MRIPTSSQSSTICQYLGCSLYPFDNGDVGLHSHRLWLGPSPLTSSSSNITWHASSVTHEERATLRNQQGFTLWFTGLSASGKSTIANALEQQLLRRSLAAYRLDGDNIRFGLNKDLGFSEKDRNENIRRIAEVFPTLQPLLTIHLPLLVLASESVQQGNFRSYD